MLSAEHLALQSRLVQQLLASRQKEIDYMLSRYQTIGVQVALIAGFFTSGLTGVTPAEPDTHNVVTFMFFIVTILGIVGCLHIMLTIMFVCNWAPGLALRGRTGSITRAFNAMRGERGMINYMFIFVVIMFGAQTVLSVWVLDNQPHPTMYAITATALMVVALSLSFKYLHSMHGRFFDDPTAEASDQPRASLSNLSRRGSRVFGGNGQTRPLVEPLNAVTEPTTGGVGAAPPPAAHAQGATADLRPQMPLLDNPTCIIQGHPDLPRSASAVGMGGGFDPYEQQELSPEYVKMGVLTKRADDRDDGTPGHTRALRRMSRALSGNEWHDRFFVLTDDGFLQYWSSEADYRQDKPGRLDRPLALSGFEVIVDMSDRKWGFMLQPTQANGRRVWHLRAKTEAERLAWSRSLVLATMSLHDS